MTGPALGHIGLITPSFRGGGVERVMINLANGLSGAGARVDLVAISAQGPFRDQVDEGIRVVDLGSPRMLRSIPALVTYLRRERPEAVLSALEYVNVATVWANSMAGSPSRVVVSTHKFFSAATRRSPLRRDRWAMPMAARLTYPRAHRIVAIAREMADDLSATLKLPRDRITVVPTPAVTAEILRKATDPVDHPWINDRETQVVVAIGRFHPEKDFETLLRAFDLLRKGSPARLILLGEGPERQSLERCIAELGLRDAVDLPGFVSNPYSYLSRADLFVLSSRNEGLPTVLIEAMACSCPVVSTDCPSGPAEILDGGTYGRLTPVGDHHALAEAMAASLSSSPEPERLKERASRYHVDRVVELYLPVLGFSTGEAGGPMISP